MFLSLPDFRFIHKLSDNYCSFCGSLSINRFSSSEKLTPTSSDHIILMFDPISQILLEIADLFCPKLIVVDDLVLPVSTAAHFPFSVIRFWIPSTIEMIPSKWISQQPSIK
jgi:hypothetical protein